jgi:hypothetical protein
MGPASLTPPDTAAALEIAGRANDEFLARDMIEVHGTEAAAVARQNARSAALRGQAERAKTWMRIVGVIQRHQTGPNPAEG